VAGAPTDGASASAKPDAKQADAKQADAVAPQRPVDA